MSDTRTQTKPGEQDQHDGSPASPNTVARQSEGRAQEWRGEVRHRRADQVSRSELNTENGRTQIADTVVAKIASIACKEIPGVHSMGGGLTRRIGALKARIPGQHEDQLSATQGVDVEVGEKQAAVDIDLVTYYGESIAEVAEAVRRNVMHRVEEMTGLEVVEVNIKVDDIHLDEEDEHSSDAEPRVQ